MDDVLALVEYCHEAAGDSLWSAFTYDDEGGETMYVRPDLRSEFREGGFEGMHRAAWAIHRTVFEQTDRPELSTLGTYRVTVHTFDEAFVFQFLLRESEGVLVVLDRDIGQNLHEFVLECERRIH